MSRFPFYRPSTTNKSSCIPPLPCFLGPTLWSLVTIDTNLTLPPSTSRTCDARLCVVKHAQCTVCITVECPPLHVGTQSILCVSTCPMFVKTAGKLADHLAGNLGTCQINLARPVQVRDGSQQNEENRMSLQSLPSPWNVNGMLISKP